MALKHFCEVLRTRAAASTLLLAVLGLAVAGCAVAGSALQLAPVGIEAASVGLSAVGVKATASREPGREEDEDEADYRDRCDNLEETPPAVIELHTVEDSTAPQWRELRIANSTNSATWTPAMPVESKSAWYPVESLYTMHFAPPLATPTPGKSAYLAYAPAEPVTPVEQEQLTSLTVDFGTNSGTFNWNGRLYNYAVVKILPCFPPPAVAMR